MSCSGNAPRTRSTTTTPSPRLADVCLYLFLPLILLCCIYYPTLLFPFCLAFLHYSLLTCLAWLLGCWALLGRQLGIFFGCACYLLFHEFECLRFDEFVCFFIYVRIVSYLNEWSLGFFFIRSFRGAIYRTLPFKITFARNAYLDLSQFDV